VLSAVEGLKLDAPQLAPAVVPISIAILVGVFLVQRKGTAFIGNIFWPVMLTWFIAIGLLGLRGIVGAPGILSALSPHHALIYLLHAGPGICFAVLGAAFLALTGAEAMYADMGHFGRLPIQRPVRCSARLVADSPLEEAGFEPSVPLLRPVLLRTSAPAFRITAPENSRVQEIEPPSRRWPPSRDRWFGSKPVELDAGLANRGNSRTGDRDLFPARTNPGFVKRRFALHTQYRAGERGPGIHAAVENRAAPFPGGSNRLHGS